ncbi:MULTISPECIES: aminotransferase [unclassified Chelatococcus]|uniref:aminotransferase n=1 Tax=unclassified Chelatococcus TaxID=2638111 RepID=UPI001BD1AF74|nr:MULTISPECIES: aminotransferase [unclassified Chelatococcus]MBS7699879.1 aminotransferase class III-fold pyridoxal phosphate-dependent enzyme [Chelatococcus sp. YT9]MBX3558775.1 aminotransferase class III-fold pyridoxal phosphate-dependent enzyme [Chelatococcus sp.]
MPPLMDAAPRPNSPEARDKAHVVHGLTNLRQHLDRGPLMIESGKGVFVRDAQGNDYLEGMSGLWCISLGFGEQRLVDAASRQMEKLPYYHLTNHRSHGPVIELATKLIEIAPVPMSHVWFASTGSEANDCAARLAWYYWHARGEPQRRKFIAHARSYHGNTIATASLSGVGYVHQQFGLPLPGFLHVECPDFYLGGQDGETEEQFSRRLLASIEALIQAEGPDTIAAFYTEPVMSSAGIVVPPAGYLEGLQALLKRYGILLVADEVVTAFGRTGAMFGTTTMGLVPDMIVCAKGITSAYFPLSAVLINARVYQAMLEQSDQLPVFGLTMTYSGHPVGAAVACEAIRIYEDDGIVAHARAMEAVLQEALRGELAGSAVVGQIRGRGLLAGVQLVSSQESRRIFDPALKVGPRIAAAAEQHGLFIRAIGDIIAICPPLIITEAEIRTLATRLALAVREVEGTL